MIIARGMVLAIAEVLLAYAISFIGLTTILYLLTKDMLTGLGMYVGFISWWGWFFRYTELDLFLQIVLGVFAPIALAIMLRYIFICRNSLKGINGLILSLTAYYIVGTVYYILLPGRRPDIDLMIAFSIWIPLLVASSYISYNILLRKHLN